MNGQKVLAVGSPVIEDLAEGVPGLAPLDMYKEHFFGTGHKDRDFLKLDTRAACSSAGHAIVWKIVFLFAERNFRLCVNRNFDTIFDPVMRSSGELTTSVHSRIRIYLSLGRIDSELN